MGKKEAQINGWMDGWKNRWVDEWMDGCMDGLIDRLMYEWDIYNRIDQNHRFNYMVKYATFRE